MATKKKVEMKLRGKNVRISGKSHELLSKYCKDNGFIMGVFIENAAINKMVENTREIISQTIINQ